MQNAPLMCDSKTDRLHWSTPLFFPPASPHLHHFQNIPGFRSPVLKNADCSFLEQAHGIIHREQFNEIPPHVEYSLTEKGKALLPVFF